MLCVTVPLITGIFFSSFQIQHLESVLSSKEESLRHAQEAHEQTVSKVRLAYDTVSYRKQDAQFSALYGIKCKGFPFGR